MKRLLLGTCLLAALFAISVESAAARATQETFRHVETVGPYVIEDLPCLEGEEFVLTGTIRVRDHLVQTKNGSHSFYWSHPEYTLVPLDGTGPTYVLRGGADHQVSNANRRSGVFVDKNVRNDTFVAYQDGKVDQALTIRIHEVWQLVFSWPDPDNADPVVRVDFQKIRLSCP